MNLCEGEMLLSRPKQSQVKCRLKPEGTQATCQREHREDRRTFASIIVYTGILYDVLDDESSWYLKHKRYHPDPLICTRTRDWKFWPVLHFHAKRHAFYVNWWFYMIWICIIWCKIKASHLTQHRHEYPTYYYDKTAKW